MLSQTPADIWEARAKWTPEYLAQHVDLQVCTFARAAASKLTRFFWQLMDNIYESQQQTFLHRDDSAPLASVIVESGPSHELVNCSAPCFFGAIRRAIPLHAENCQTCGASAGKRPYLQFTAELGPRFGSLWGDIASGDAATFGVGELASGPTSNLWIGGPGVTTSGHYDSYHVRS